MRTLLTMFLATGLTLAEAGGTVGPLAGQDSPQTATLSGVAMPTQLQVEGRVLVLNGMALRKRVIFKVYVAGLYLPAKETDADRILARDAPRHLVMQFLRSVDAQALCEAWNDGLAANTPDASQALKAQYVTLCTWMEDVAKGDQFAFTYLPGRGTTVEVKGRPKGTLEGKAFADALFKSWIGPKPGPGEDFKRSLLGR